MVHRLAVLVMAGVLFFIAAAPASAASPPVLRGKALVLMDGRTGQVLYQQNGGDRVFPASTTKLLTALVALEHGKLDQVIQVSREAVSKGPDSASCYVSEGEEQPLEYLLYGLLLKSGNDCADAIAEGVTGGKPEQFVAWMNEEAARLGASQTHFTNPHGLHDPNHYTTAIDLAIISRTALADPTLRKIAGTREFVWPGKNNGTYYNLNGMLWDYPGTIGGKTGYTNEANHNLVNAAERNGQLLIAVVMGYEQKAELYADLEALTNYGFAEFAQSEAVEADAPEGEVKVIDGKAPSVAVVAKNGFTVSVPRSGSSNVTVTLKIESEQKAPIEAGDKLGVLEVREGGQLLGSVPVVAKESVEARPPLWAMAGRWSVTGLKWAAGLLAGLFLFRTVVKGIRRRLRRRRRMPTPVRLRSVGGRWGITRF